MHQWMTLISLSATMTLNAVNYEQLTDGTISSALTATNISRNRPDTQDMMNIILNGNRALNNENNKNFANTNQPDGVDGMDQLNNTISTVNSSVYNGQQRRESSNLEHSNPDDLKQLSESGSESGFANYKSRRQSKTNSELESFNSVGLPTAASSSNGGNYSSIYSSAAHKGPITSSAAANLPGLPAPSSQLVNQQIANKMQQQQPIYAPKRPHYMNAPPKPKRQQPQAGSSMDADFETYSSNGGHAFAASNATKPMQMMPGNPPPDLIDANGYPPHDLYSIPPTHLQPRTGSFSNQPADEQQTDENLYMRRSTLTRQNASDSGRITPMDDSGLLANGHQPPIYGAQYYDNGNLNPIKSRPKSSQERQQFDSAGGQHYNANLQHMQGPVEQLNSPSYRPWSDFLHAQRSQSTTPMSTKQNRLQGSTAVFNQPPPSAAINNSSTSALAASALSSAAVVALGTQPTSHAQLSSVFGKANRYDGKISKD